MSGLSHMDESGAARMVDVSAKESTERSASATGTIVMERTTLAAIQSNTVQKGDVLAVARVAGIMAAKRTAELIPLCHPLPLSAAQVELDLDESVPGVRCRATIRTVAQTGVEMEALTAVVVSLATIYDMVKALDRGMIIRDVRVLEKKGGRSG
jgi:cyclic pyranopterin monophosphate synthase